MRYLLAKEPARPSVDCSSRNPSRCRTRGTPGANAPCHPSSSHATTFHNHAPPISGEARKQRGGDSRDPGGHVKKAWRGVGGARQARLGARDRFRGDFAGCGRCAVCWQDTQVLPLLPLRNNVGQFPHLFGVAPLLLNPLSPSQFGRYYPSSQCTSQRITAQRHYSRDSCFRRRSILVDTIPLVPTETIMVIVILVTSSKRYYHMVISTVSYYSHLKAKCRDFFSKTQSPGRQCK